MTLYHVFRNLFRRAGIKKRFNPHLFRHSRATWCVEEGWTTFQLCQHFGWELDSGMPAVYVSLVDKTGHDKMRETYGLKPTTPRDRVYEPCPRCQAVNARQGQFCYRCGMALSLAPAKEVESRTTEAHRELTTLLADPRVARLLRKILAEQTGTDAADVGQPARQEAPPKPDHPGTMPLLPASTA
jgi:hypothetical protein